MSDDGIVIPKGVKFSLQVLYLQLEDSSWAAMASVGGNTHSGHVETSAAAHFALRESIVKGRKS